MTNSYSITGIFSRLIELIKKRLNSTTAWETTPAATFNMTDLSSACQMPMQNPRHDNSDLRELLAQATKKATTPDSESAIRHIRVTPYDKELKVAIETEINKLNEMHNKTVIRKQIELYGKSFAFNYSDQNGEWTLWPKTAEEYWRIAKEDFAAQRGEQENTSPELLATMAEITDMIIELRGKQTQLPKGLIESFMFTEKKPYHCDGKHYIVHNDQVVNSDDTIISPAACRALIRAKRDFDASIDTGEIYQIYMRLFGYLTMKERHLLYPVLCKQGPAVGIDDSTLSNISEVISNDDFCLKYKEIYDIFYQAK